MKLYNPFKWHIIEQNGLFYVRKYTIGLGWMYLDSHRATTLEWMRCVPNAGFPLLEKAQDKLKNYPALLQKEKDKQKIKVHV